MLMKKINLSLIKVITLVSMLLTFSTVSASDFLLSIQNEQQTAANKLEFDVYMQNTRTSPLTYELATIQLGLLFNSSIYTGGTVSASISNAGSGLVSGQQFTATPNTATQIAGQTVIKLAGRTPVGAGNGTLISATAPGTLITHFTITISVNFTSGVTPNLTFISSTAVSPYYVTSVSEYISSVNTLLSVTSGVDAIANANPELNQPPTAFAVTGTGTTCAGTGGLPVGLANSEVGVTYTLYNGTTALTPTVAGTGSAISFGNQLAGTYTVKGTNFGGTTDMTGNAIITENPALPASVIIAPSANNVCAGTSVTFTATPTNGGTTPVYQWFKGATAVGTNSATFSYVPANGDIISVKLTSNASPCLTGSPATSNSVTMVVNAILTASVSIAPSANNVCAGTSVTFTATPTNGGTTPVYQWYKGATAVGTNSATFSYVPVNGDMISVKMTSNATPCLTGSPATSNTVTMVVNPILTASVSIAPSANNVCAGTSVTFTATPTNGGTTPVYQWFKSATAVGTNSATFSYVPANGDVISVVMTSNATPCLTGSPATSNTVTMVVNPILPASVSIAPTANNVCAGTSVTFTATPTNGGTTPAYQWFNGATAVGTNSATFTYVPVNGDVIKAIMTSNAACVSGSPATSNTVTMVVNPILTASVSIAPSANNVCAGTSVTFTATPTNGGTTPTYQWFKGATAVGTNSATFSYVPANGDMISVKMTSNATPCLTGSPATSNTVTMVVNPILTASVSITPSANPVNAGTPVTFTATPTTGGTAPTYQWHNGATLVGTNSDIFTYTPINNDVIYVIMTSDAICVTGSPATSNSITIAVVGFKESKISANIYSQDKNIYVNCSEKANQIYIYSATGSLVMMKNNVSGLTEFNMNNEPSAYYLVKIVTESDYIYTQKVLLK